jgi:hypothetical protein
MPHNQCYRTLGRGDDAHEHPGVRDGDAAPLSAGEQGGEGPAEKGRLLTEFSRVTGYHRKAATRLLQPVSAVARPAGATNRGGRPRQYGPAVQQALVAVWEAADRPCGKRLAPFLAELVPQLERHGEVALEPAVRASLLALSAATIDRLVAPVRRARGRQPRGTGVGADGLRATVPVRSFGEWREVAPGALQADLVLHCGETTAGFFLTSLVAVDVATSWVEVQPIWGKGQQRVGSGVHFIRQRLPFPLRELHTDNGSEFLNAVLVPWCRREGVQLTRGRPYHKNDQAYVEQRNWTVVRRLVGYDRYSSKAALAQLLRLYGLVTDYMNYFQPVRKVVAKERVGARVRKRYDAAQTPYQRLRASGGLDAAAQADLAVHYAGLNPVRLRAQIDAALQALWTAADREPLTE